MTRIFCAISISEKPSRRTRIYLSFILLLSFLNTTYFLCPFTTIFVRLSIFISLETVACVTLKPASIRAAASSSCVSMSFLFIISRIFLCLSDFTIPSFCGSHKLFANTLQKTVFIRFYK